MASAPKKSETVEARKRKRERRVAVFLTVIFVVTTTAQVFFTDRAQGYGIQQSLLYFALLYLNVILIMLLVFLVSRNLIRAYLARKSGSLGGGLRWRLVSSLLFFSMAPAIVLFVASSYVIRQGFDRWFGGQVSSALEDSQAIADVHYNGIEGNLEFFSGRARERLVELKRTPLETDLLELLRDYPVEAIEIYPNLVRAPLRVLSEKTPAWAVPRAATESLERALKGESFHLIRQYGDGDLVQRYVPLTIQTRRSSPTYPGNFMPDDFVLVMSYTVPLGLKTRIGELRSSFAGYQQTRLLKDSLKTNYTLVLLTLFVLILFVVSWFGLYIAKSIIDPVSELLKGTEAFREGRWDYRIATDWTPRKILGPSPGTDLEVLKSAFNLMAEEVGQKSRQIEEANAQLVSLVRDLEERERYLENLLSSIRRGVVVLSPELEIQRINDEALEFSFDSSRELGWETEEALGRGVQDVFPSLGTPDELLQWLEQSQSAGGRPVDQIFELRRGAGRSSTLQSVRGTSIWILDEYQHPLGWLVILEDVSDAARLERLAAWQEVARRVAHEIKNPLTPIQISADRLRRRVLPAFQDDPVNGPILEECLGQISKQVRVIRDLVREFSEFAKLPEPNFDRVLIVDCFQSLLDDYRFTHPQCRFEFEVDQKLHKTLVRADREYLRRLFVNLADNALQSMEDAQTPEPRFRVRMETGDDSSSMLRIVFEDNGPGIPESMREKIFDPYMTSKASGLGLGLAIVRRIAIEHLGRVRCEEGEGARFVLEVPTLGGENHPHV
jgi:two-component system, NtrC family, nitrogen regulation sensor histidine kinase NtrY